MIENNIAYLVNESISLALKVVRGYSETLFPSRKK